ncbi:MAG: LCP family protein [Candidatus Magasanikbacteria bacterium]|nr:LCP family protein [Candidatus Magasanikbacteria bacterium]
MNRKITIIFLIIISGLCLWLLVRGILWYRNSAAEHAAEEKRNQAIEDIIDSRRLLISEDGKGDDPFGEDKVARVLLIGLDSRIGQESGHCDAIQLITIDNNTSTVSITAVPRGTYSPLPPGKGTTSSDYYVSNACGLGGLEYGITQIEKILGVKADYLVVVGFSEATGILRNLRLPTTETLQWLRHRQGYAIGEPQRAHNHSTFLKQMMIKFVPTKISKLDTALEYIVFKLLKTDLSFTQANKILDAISAMDIANHPEKVQLFMRPLYPVQDIPYDPEGIEKYLDQTLGPIKHLLNKADYSGVQEETVQAKLLGVIDENKNNSEFISWAYKNNLWLQIEDDNMRLNAQYDILVSYLVLLPDKQEREFVIADYILEMENRGEIVWQGKARELLRQENEEKN